MSELTASEGRWSRSSSRTVPSATATATATETAGYTTKSVHGIGAGPDTRSSRCRAGALRLSESLPSGLCYPRCAPGVARVLQMPNISLSSLSTLIATALLVLLLAPLALCDQAASCPMRQSADGEMDCVPGPTFDCCEGDEAPRPGGSEPVAAKHLQAAVAVGAPAVVAPPSPSRRERGRAVEPLGSAADLPLYTLLATLLI